MEEPLVGDFVPLGSKVTVKKIDTDTAILVFEDPTRTVTLDIEDANPDPTFVLDRILGSTAPSLRGLGKTDRSGIKDATILEGMTRKAVFLAAGYPPYVHTPPFRKDSAINHDPKASELTYMKSTCDFPKVTFKGIRSPGSKIEIHRSGSRPCRVPSGVDGGLIVHP